MRFAGVGSMVVWAVYGIAALLVVSVAGPIVVLGDRASTDLGIGEAMSGVLIEGLLIVGAIQLAISAVGIWLGSRAARGHRPSLAITGAMHAIYAAGFMAAAVNGAAPAGALAAVTAALGFACLRAATRPPHTPSTQ